MMNLKIDAKDLVWIPAKVIKREGKLYLVQPLDGWSQHQLWSSNWKKEVPKK